MSAPEKHPKDVKWEVLGSKELLHVPSRLTVSVQKLRLPDGRVVEDYCRVIFPDSVVMVAVTAERKVVMSRQYLHGFGYASIVLPAGTANKGEDPLQTAKRELLEETGYASDDWLLLGAPYSHTNYAGGKVSFFLARDARKLAEPDPGDLEEMEILLLDEAEVVRSIRDKKIVSMGSIAGLAMAKVYY